MSGIIDLLVFVIMSCMICVWFSICVSILTVISTPSVIRCHRSYIFKLHPAETGDNNFWLIHTSVKPAYDKIPKEPIICQF